ncbi:MAG: zinc-binding dehydrogenase, partial [Actinomycetota bacterium]|nr:zinc-binding dehydrogenase [Actinomycetota bacterium]
IDVYFDNVGGDHLEAAIGSMRRGGRVAVCGMISSYNDTEPPPGPRNLGMLIGKRLTIRGFLVTDHADLRPQFEQEVGTWVRDGRIVFRETVVEGVERTVDAFRSLLAGGNTGKMLVRL